MSAKIHTAIFKNIIMIINKIIMLLLVLKYLKITLTMKNLSRF